MLQTLLLHPQLLRVLAESGHGSKVLIADSNYPFATHAHPGAARVFLNLRPGLIDAIAILRVLRETIPIEAAEVMQPNDGDEPPIFAEFRALLPDLILTAHDRFAFYDRVCQPDVALVIASGEQRVYANLLLTIGVVRA